MVELGNKAKCTVTGFEGIAVARVEYLNGCIQFCIKPKVSKDGKHPEGIYIDEEQLVVVSKGVKAVRKKTGGIMSDTPAATYR